jgi:hypothetical protein
MALDDVVQRQPDFSLSTFKPSTLNQLAAEA